MRFLDPRIMEALGGAAPGEDDAGALAPKSRFDLVREYLEATRQAEESPSIPEADVETARRRDLSESLTRGFSKAGRAFLGDRSALEESVGVSTAEDKARAANAARAKALADWAESRGARRLTEASLMERLAGAESREGVNLSETERRRQRDATEAQRKADEAAAKAQAEKDKAEERRLRAAGAAAARAQRAADKESAAEAKAKTAGFKSSMDLRKEFNGLPEVKDFKDVDVAFRKIQSAVKNVSAAGDLSLIFQYMKMLDPGSTVREGEFANAQNAGGIDDKVRAAYNNVTQGQRLTESQRADFLAQARGVHEAQRQQFDSAREMFRALAEKGGIDPDDVTGGAAQPRPASTPDTPPIPPTGKVQMLDVESGEPVFLSPQNAEALLKRGKVRKP